MATKTLKIATQREIIEYTGKDMGYLDGRELVKNKGGLPSHLLHDNTLVRFDGWKSLNRKKYYGAWVREINVYPEKDGRFKKGMDVVDAVADSKGRIWKLPGSAIPKEAFEVEKPSLFVDPGIESERIRITETEVVIADPVSVTLITPSIQVNAQVGKVDEATRMPLYVDDALREQLTDEEKRWLYRIDGTGVRPLVRDYLAVYGNRRYVLAYCGQDYGYGVGWVSLSQAEPEQADAKKSPSWLIALQRDADAAQQSVSRLEGVVNGDHLVSLRQLIRKVKALDIKE
jgi:hypothetical protein